MGPGGTLRNVEIHTAFKAAALVWELDSSAGIYGSYGTEEDIGALLVYFPCVVLLRFVAGKGIPRYFKHSLKSLIGYITSNAKIL